MEVRREEPGVHCAEDIPIGDGIDIQLKATDLVIRKFDTLWSQFVMSTMDLSDVCLTTRMLPVTASRPPLMFDIRASSRLGRDEADGNSMKIVYQPPIYTPEHGAESKDRRSIRRDTVHCP
jgi:hypothetical protein